jgi:hypothetical protein
MIRLLPVTRQPDLFAPDDPPVVLAAVDLGRLMPLVSALLTEAITARPTTESDREDHA